MCSYDPGTGCDPCSGTCACDDGGSAERTNAPGLDAVDYRSGLTHGDVLARMTARLPAVLPGLTGATPDDPAAALLDSWATVSEVVSFYQERIANEGWLRTATERSSVLELARAIGYELRPGVSASTLLAVRMQEATGSAATPVSAPATATLAPGTQVRSVPAPGTLPQTFETSEELAADVARNELRLVQAQPQTLTLGATTCLVVGTVTGLRTGDVLVVTDGPAVATPASFDIVRVMAVEPVAAAAPDLPACTHVTWDTALTRTYLAGEVTAFAAQATYFGSNAPDFRTLPDATRKAYDGNNPGPEWPGFDTMDPVDLDAEYPAATVPVVPSAPAGQPEQAPASVALFQAPGKHLLVGVRSTRTVNRADFAVSARVTELELKPQDVPPAAQYPRRSTVIHVGNRTLPLAGVPIGGTVGGQDSATTLDVLGPAPLVDGRRVLVVGTAGGVPAVEAARALRVGPAPRGRPPTDRVLVLDRPLTTAFARDSVRVLANVVEASHGETVRDEVLGSGNGTMPHQSFALARKHLTHLPEPGAPGGVRAQLEVRVDDVVWTPVQTLYGMGPHDRVYVVRVADDGTATVLFGDGEHGARLPTGRENVHARYRTGSGPDGHVAAQSLTLLPTRPPGVASVENPAPAGGDAPPEALDDARRNAPLTVLTLDRVVSLADHETFAAGFGGIARARATRMQGRSGPFVHLSLAGPDGTRVEDLTVEHLRAGLDAVRDPSVTVRTTSIDPTGSRFALAVEVIPNPDRVPDTVRAAVTAALTAMFDVGRREFGQPVTVAEVLAATQHEPGVRACRVTDLRPEGDPGPAVSAVLAARPARQAPVPGVPDRVLPDDLLLLAPGQPVVTVVRP